MKYNLPMFSLGILISLFVFQLNALSYEEYRFSRSVIEQLSKIFPEISVEKWQLEIEDEHPEVRDLKYELRYHGQLPALPRKTYKTIEEKELSITIQELEEVIKELELELEQEEEGMQSSESRKDIHGIFYLLSWGRYQEALQMLKEGKVPDVNMRSDKGYTPLLFVAFSSRGNKDALELARELIKQGADINAVGQGVIFSNSTPLTLAASRQGSPEMVQLLLESGATRGIKKALKEAQDDSSFSRRWLHKIDDEAERKVQLLEAAIAKENK